MKLSRLVMIIFYSTALFGQAQDPKILEDGGLSIEPIYWLNHTQPALFGGKTATADGDLSYLGQAKNSEGLEIGVPAGRANTLRFSYFRAQGSSNSTQAVDGTIFDEAFTTGDYLATTYRLQNVKISWDYLSYTFEHSKIRFKTLYEVQYNTISTDVSAPLKAQVTDASGNTDTNSSHGAKNLVLPTFGAEFSQPISSRIRWEVKGSGFGLPHRAVIWDTQADVALRLRSLEFLIGGKAYHLKTSPNTDQYFTDTLKGMFVGLRYYWGQAEN